MKISVITITYNSEATIRDTIESVLSQEYDELEYIIVDGNSKDKTVEIAKSYADRITKIISEPDKGLYDALNKGIKHASGEVVGFMHSDDVYASKSVLKTIAEVFEKNDVDSFYGDLIYVEKDNIDKVTRLWRAHKFSRKKMLYGWMPPHPTFYVKKKVYEKFGGFDLSFRISADYENMLRLLVKNRISTFYVPMFIVKMRVGGESNRSLKNIIRKTREDVKAVWKNGLFFASVFAIINKNISKFKQFMKPKWLTRSLTID
jgi:glycosyltransferase